MLGKRLWSGKSGKKETCPPVFDPRKVEIMMPGQNDKLIKNSAIRQAQFDANVKRGGAAPEFPVAWTSKDLSLVVGVCEYLRDCLPEGVYGPRTIPGFQIFPEPDCLAIGAMGPDYSSYRVIRPGPVGLYATYPLALDLEEEWIPSGNFSRFEDALKEFVYSWLVTVGGVQKGEDFDFGVCAEGVEMVPFDWDEHKSLFTAGQQHYLEEIARETLQLFGKDMTPENINTAITKGDMIYRSTTNENAWYVGNHCPYFNNISHGLNTDIYTFMNMLIVAMDRYRRSL
ncbi:hypothetical protein L1O03_08415 [Corynebacterium uropygiale]|uniref:Uncharacterized protein n=1 Tax=Corynebacterium uropygiale TaxID=1775911 RepID=A0A9X1QS56_9CORY|nr:hypothetical protein [Corynebacterium uropygiale]MCF4007195.1 hypothetical protein [Corynebacterium uropygiale]